MTNNFIIIMPIVLSSLILVPLASAFTQSLHNTFEKCYKIIAPSYLRNSLTAPATALLEKWAIGNMTITNTNNTLVQPVSAYMQGKPYTPMVDLNK